ncbi:hypothetical protein NLJ89_g10559 [Agrocybe chaxingu]|uniref:Uncharacterized protein n=1 Tax=Agrocybe chaxingu TaxID=84603 RepID=A0A9W8JRK1_9AGAR|nr:hypothetical protein NLJ89_g10559 [Agrocybe chaxingu]
MHINAVVTNTLKVLPLMLKLEWNKKIEAKNLNCQDQAMDHLLDPTAHPDPGLEQASFFTIDSVKLDSLKLPGVEKAEKQKHEDSLMDSNKHILMDRTTLVKRTPGQVVEFNFPKILRDTEEKVPLPLSFFTYKSLTYIVEDLTLLPIIEVMKLAEILGDKGSLDFGQYMQATNQMYTFQKGWGNKEWAAWYLEHFLFFEAQPDNAEFYDAWKDVEICICHDQRNLKRLYNMAYYDFEYMQAKSRAKEHCCTDSIMLQTDSGTLPACLAASETQGCPFRYAAAGLWHLHAAYSVPNRAMHLANTHSTNYQPNLQMVLLPGQSSTMAACRPLRARTYASITISMARTTAPTSTTTPPVAPTSAPSVAPTLTTPSPGHATPNLPTIEDFLNTSICPQLVTQTNILANHPSVLEHDMAINEYLQDEVAAG